MHEDCQYILAILQGYHHMHSSSQKNNTGSDQWDRKETSTKQVQQVK